MKPGFISMTMRTGALLVLPAAALCGTAAAPDKDHRPGLIGAWYGDDAFERFKDADPVSSLDLTWPDDVADERGRVWAAWWEGHLVAPDAQEFVFVLESDARASLEVDGRQVVATSPGATESSAALSLEPGKSHPIRVTYVSDINHRGGHLRVRWSWPGQPPVVPAGDRLHHTTAQARPVAEAVARMEALEIGTVPPLRAETENAIVYHERGRIGAWPANHGAWSWGEELLVGFQQGRSKARKFDHSLDRRYPVQTVLARSRDGGRTWQVEDPDNFFGDSGEPLPGPGRIDFGHEDLALAVREAEYFVSYDRGHQWQGPHRLPSGGREITARTDYLPGDLDEGWLFVSAVAPGVEADHKDRAFAMHTTDGGRTYDVGDWMTDETEVRSVMPSTVRVGPGRLVTALRRAYQGTTLNPNDHPFWIDAFGSEDSGRTWQRLGKVADTDTGWHNGNPPSLVRLPDGRLVVTYGYRGKPYGIRAKISTDEGRTWGAEIALRLDGRTWDLGYPRTLVRPDGRLVTIYYFNTEERPELHLEASIWSADAVHPNPSASAASPSSVKVAGLKILPTPGDKAANFARFEQFAREAERAGAKVLVTPEGYLDGYAGSKGLFPEVTASRLRELAEPADGEYVTRARRLADELDVLLVFGCSERRGDQFFNTAFLIDGDGNINGRYSKSHLNAKNEALYSPGTEFPVFDTTVGKVGMLICFDRQPAEPARILGVRGARLVLIPGYSRKVDEVNEILLLRVRAFENGFPIAWVSPHNVMMIDRDGNVLAEDRTGDDGIIYATFDLSPPEEERDAIANRHPDLYGALVGRPPVSP